MSDPDKVFPEILRHPENCQIITHGENVSKRFKLCGCCISLEELFIKIEQYKGNLDEQEKCIKLIKKYRQGEIYDKLKYIYKES